MRELLYLVGLAAVILGVYAVDVTNDKKELQQAVHAHYTNEMVNATEQMTELSDAILEVQLLNDNGSADEAKQEVWRLSSELRNAITKLPLDTGLANDMMQYYAKIGEMSKQADSDWRGVAQNVKAMEEEWRVATAKMLNENSGFEVWQQQVKDQDPHFQTVAKGIKEYREADFPLTASESDYQKKKELAHLEEKEVTKQQAVARIKELLPTLEGATFTVSTNAKDAAYPFYHIQFVRGARLGYADVTKKGGHILSFLIERPTGEQNISQQQAKQSAEDFLKQVGYTDTKFIEVRENHEAWHFVFSRVANDAIVYPDSVQIKVAKDEREILGFNAMEYIQKEKLPSQGFAPLDVTKIFGQDVQLEPAVKIYTENDAFELIPAYEVIARQYGETFRLVIDAQKHKVLQMEQMP